MALYAGKRAGPRCFSHVRTRRRGGAWGGRHPSWTCDSNSLGRDASGGYEPPVLSMLDRGGGCFKRSP
jgi:hypothetical protein